MTHDIEVVPYDSRWPQMFNMEAKQIKRALGDNCVAIHHIGSTSVPGLSAKPIIDILLVVTDIQEVDRAIEAMECLEYEAKGEYGIAFRRYFQKGKNCRTHNVHAYQEYDPEINRYIKFRDWIQSHPDDATTYSKLKTELALKFPQDIVQYCNGKDAFVANIDRKSGFDGWRMVQALTHREWSTIEDLLRKYFLKSTKSPYRWTFEHKDHVHFVFYKNSDVVGYVHLQFLPEKRGVLRVIVIDENCRGKGLGRQFLKLCERWLSQQRVVLLLVISPPGAYPFYNCLGYKKMSFNDLDGYEIETQDIKMGKFILNQLDR